MARITLRIPDALHVRLTAAARSRGESINQLIVDSIDQALPAPHELTEQEKLRQALGDMLADPEVLLRGLVNPEIPVLGHEELARRMPVLHPSASEMIIADREDRL